MKLLVLGAGMQGRVIAANLAARKETAEVGLGDLRAPAGLPANVRGVAVNALDASEVARAARGFDAAVLALPGEIAMKALENLIAARVPTVDLSFTPQLPYHLDGAAKAAGVPVVCDFGVAPGLSHVLAADVRRSLGGLDKLRIYVGGMPLAPPPVFHHAVYFNARDLLSEYVRPARVREHGKDAAPAPLDAPVETLHDAEVGPLEAFVSDGLRSLLSSYPDVPDMREMTLRVPGHLDAMRTLRALGCLDGNATTDAVADAIGRKYPADAHPDRLLMEVWGELAGRRKTWRLHATREKGESAMSRTTGYSAAAATVLLATGAFTVPGVHPPEKLGEDAGATRAILADLAERGLRVSEEKRLRSA